MPHAAGAHQIHHVRAPPARAGRAHVPRGDLGPQHSGRSTAWDTTTTGEAIRLTTTMRRRSCRRGPSCTSWFPRHHSGQQESGRPRKLGRRRPAVGRQHVHRPWLRRCRSPKSSFRPRWPSDARTEEQERLSISGVRCAGPLRCSRRRRPRKGSRKAVMLVTELRSNRRMTVAA